MGRENELQRERTAKVLLLCPNKKEWETELGQEQLGYREYEMLYNR